MRRGTALCRAASFGVSFNAYGLNIEIVDQDGRSMFPEGSKESNERTRRLIQKLAVPLKAAAFRISISGHTSATRLPARPSYGPWELSADRANAVRKLLEADGVPTSHMYMVAGVPTRSRSFPMIPISRPIVT